MNLLAMDQPTSTTAGDGPVLSIENALSEALSLIENALTRHRGLGAERSVIDLSGSDEIIAITTRKLISEARRELLCVSTPENMLGGPLRATMERLRNRSDQEANVQVLFHLRTPDAYHRIRSQISATEAQEMRVTHSPLQEMLLVDRQVAMVISQLGPAVRQTLIVRSPAILKALHGLFTSSWGSASPISPIDRAGDPRQDETTRQILASLRDGYKDDVAARELGMSVRTYRRHVADIMREVNATSRFQAGVRAAELRLLPASS